MLWCCTLDRQCLVKNIPHCPNSQYEFARGTNEVKFNLKTKIYSIKSNVCKVQSIAENKHRWNTKSIYSQTFHILLKHLQTRPVSNRKGEKGKMTNRTPRIIPICPGMSANSHIEDICRKDMRACRRTRSVRHVACRPFWTTISLFLFIHFFSLFIFIIQWLGVSANV